jgi:hypothetical protein
LTDPVEIFGKAFLQRDSNDFGKFIRVIFLDTGLQARITAGIGLD